MPTPWPGVFSEPLSTVFTGTLAVTEAGEAFSCNRQNAPQTSIRPAPCSYAPTPGTNFADDLIASRSAAAGGRWPWCVALYALISNAPAPAACGEAIDVPCSIAYPAGSV